jgi:hypothetical protein
LAAALEILLPAAVRPSPSLCGCLSSVPAGCHFASRHRLSVVLSFVFIVIVAVISVIVVVILVAVIIAIITNLLPGCMQNRLLCFFDQEAAEGGFCWGKSKRPKPDHGQTN